MRPRASPAPVSADLTYLMKALVSGESGLQSGSRGFYQRAGNQQRRPEPAVGELIGDRIGDANG